TFPVEQAAPLSRIPTAVLLSKRNIITGRCPNRKWYLTQTLHRYLIGDNVFACLCVYVFMLCFLYAWMNRRKNRFSLKSCSPDYERASEAISERKHINTLSSSVRKNHKLQRFQLYLDKVSGLVVVAEDVDFPSAAINECKHASNRIQVTVDADVFFVFI